LPDNSPDFSGEACVSRASSTALARILATGTPRQTSNKSKKGRFMLTNAVRRSDKGLLFSRGHLISIFYILVARDDVGNSVQENATA
jgi:hypothetical protein